MTIEYTGIGYGIEFDGGKVIFDVTGAPTGSTKENSAPIGSLALSDNGKSYRKTSAGSGADKWVEEVTKDYVDSVANGLSWREPALVLDSTVYADLTAAETAVNTGTIDGETVAANDRILFTAITGQNKNVFIVTGTPGAGATLVEDTNTATSGDALYVQEGTEAGKQYSFDGTNWIQSGGTSVTEIGFIRSFIGKTSTGAVLPNYASNNYITDNDDLVEAISDLDVQVGVNATNIGTNATNISTLFTTTGNLQTEINLIETSLGTMVDGTGTWVGFSGTNYLDSSTSTTNALTLLDTRAKTNADNIASLQGVANVAIDVLSAAAGTTSVATVSVDLFRSVTWEISVIDAVTGGVQFYEIKAIHDGKGASDATQVKHIIPSKFKIGSVTGVDVNVVLTGSGAGQQMELTVTHSNVCDITTMRSGYTKAS